MLKKQDYDHLLFYITEFELNLFAISSETPAMNIGLPIPEDEQVLVHFAIVKKSRKSGPGWGT